MGKTSLVEHVCSLIDTTDIRIAHIDAFGCRSEHDFVNAFATAVVRATSSKWEEWMENTKTFLSRFVPKISFGQDPLNDFSLSFEYNPANNATEEVLQLPELIARTKGYRIVVCIDEFQQIGEFADSLTFQKKLRSVWQLQSNVSYCLYGSKKHMMERMFQREAIRSIVLATFSILVRLVRTTGCSTYNNAFVPLVRTSPQNLHKSSVAPPTAIRPMCSSSLGWYGYAPTRPPRATMCNTPSTDCSMPASPCSYNRQKTSRRISLISFTLLPTASLRASHRQQC